jgi:mTERF domain-containing protein, mitochondrial
MMNYCRTFFISKLLKTSSQYQIISKSIRSASEIVPKTDDSLEPIENEKINVKKFLEKQKTGSMPSFNLAAYANNSELLQNFMNLGVNLSKIESRRGLGEFILRLDWERDVKNHLLFLKDLGVPPEAYGALLTKNPLIFKESIDDLETRIYYLQSKKFNLDNICRIVTGNPYWLSFSTKRIDRRLGWFQKEFKLAGNELREVVVKCPKLITYNLNHVKDSTFSIKEEMGFEKHELKSLMISNPKLWTIGE